MGVTRSATELADRLGPDSHDGQGRHWFPVTDALAAFAQVAPRFFGGPVDDLHLVDVVPASAPSDA